jgi:hypothetical protein
MFSGILSGYMAAANFDWRGKSAQLSSLSFAIIASYVWLLHPMVNEPHDLYLRQRRWLIGPLCGLCGP